MTDHRAKIRKRLEYALLECLSDIRDHKTGAVDEVMDAQMAVIEPLIAELERHATFGGHWTSRAALAAAGEQS